MKMVRGVCAAGMVVGMLGGMAGVASASPKPSGPEETPNVAGYGTTSPSGYSATGTFTVPKVDCDSVANPDVVQEIAGVNANGGLDAATVTIECVSGVPDSFVYFETDNGTASVEFNVAPGNLVYLSTAAVHGAPAGEQFKLAADDLSTGQKANVTGGTDTQVTATDVVVQAYFGSAVPSFSPVVVLAATIDGTLVNNKTDTELVEYDGANLAVNCTPALLGSFILTRVHS